MTTTEWLERLDALAAERGYEYEIAVESGTESAWSCKVHVEPKNVALVYEGVFFTSCGQQGPDDALTSAVEVACRWLHSA